MAFLEGIFVNLNRFEFEKDDIIGKGAFGFCYIVRDKENPGKLLCAKITHNIVEDSKGQEELLREVVILKNIKHNAILGFTGFNLFDFDQQPRPTIITEYMKNGSLDKMLEKEAKKEAPKDWNYTKKQICIIGVAAAMRYLHRRNLMHRDLKPANVLLDDNLYPKVCDFGFARATKRATKQATKQATNTCQTEEEEELMTKMVGTPIYMAPEILKGDKHYTQQCDVYSFAILAYELSTGEKPFADFYKKYRHPSLSDLLKWVVVQQNRPKFDKGNVNKNFQSLIEACWHPSPEKRPSFDIIYDNLVDDCTLVINDKVQIREVQNYIDSIQDDSVKGGKAKLETTDPLTIYDDRPVQTDDIIPSLETEREKMFNSFMQNGFSGDVDVEIALFTKMKGSITTNKDPTNFVKITFFANKLVQEGNKKAAEFLKEAFGGVIGKGKKTLSKKDIPDTNVTSLNVSPTIETIQPETFAGLKNLLYVNLPPNIKILGQNAFKGCKNLIWINLNSKITEIEPGTFEDCSNLKYIEFSPTITSIKEGAFKKCVSLEQVHIPKSVNQIEKNAFHGCKKLKIVHMNPSTEYATASSFPLRTQIIKQ